MPSVVSLSNHGPSDMPFVIVLCNHRFCFLENYDIQKHNNLAFHHLAEALRLL